MGKQVLFILYAYVARERISEIVSGPNNKQTQLDCKSLSAYPFFLLFFSLGSSDEIKTNLEL